MCRLFLYVPFTLPALHLAPLAKAKSLAFSYGPVDILNRSYGYALKFLLVGHQK